MSNHGPKNRVRDPLTDNDDPTTIADGYPAFPKPEGRTTPSIDAILVEVNRLQDVINDNNHQRNVSTEQLAYIEEMKDVEDDRLCYIKVSENRPELLYLNLPRYEIRRSLELAEIAIKRNRDIFAMSMLRARLQIRCLEEKLADEATKNVNLEVPGIDGSGTVVGSSQLNGGNT